MYSINKKMKFCCLVEKKKNKCINDGVLYIKLLKLICKKHIFWINIISSIILVYIKLYFNWYIPISTSIGFVVVGLVTFLLVFYFNYTYDLYKIHCNYLSEFNKEIINIITEIKNSDTNLNNNDDSHLEKNTELVDKSINLITNYVTSNLEDITTNLEDKISNLEDRILNIADITTNLEDITTNLKDITTNLEDRQNYNSNLSYKIIKIMLFYLHCNILFFNQQLCKLEEEDIDKKLNNSIINISFYLEDIPSNKKYISKCMHKIISLARDIKFHQKQDLPYIYEVFIFFMTYSFLFLINFVIVGNTFTDVIDKNIIHNFTIKILAGILNLGILMLINFLYIGIKEISKQIVDPYGEDITDFKIYDKITDVVRVYYELIKKNN